MKKISFFKIGLILAVAGTLWIGLVFSNSDKINQSFNLNVEQTARLTISLPESGIGFYKTSIPDFDDSIFIQVLDPDENVIADKKIETKMAINYFDFKKSGTYALKITNLSEDNIAVEIEFGDTSASQMRNPGIVLFIGIMLMIIFAFVRLKNYNIAQPDEKIS